MENNSSTVNRHNVIVVGAGAAGIGVAIVLQELGMEYVVLEKNEIGSSFKQWPAESRFISPSFIGNFFNMPDLNSITPETSPAFNLQTEHPTGKEFATYLEMIVEEYEVNIETGITVNSIQKTGDSFVLDTNEGTYESKYVIWAAGEFQYPQKGSFEGDELCTHFSEIDTFSDLKGDERIIVGAYESGFDTAINLVRLNKKVTIIDSDNYVELVNSDSSYSLSPYTRDRLRNIYDKLSYHKETRVEKVEYIDDEYIVTTDSNKQLRSKHKPINCTGFATSISLISDLFEHSDGYPLINEFDESIKTDNLFLVGPQVKHENALFCFIYKYRQRFAIVAEEIAGRENISSEVVDGIIGAYQMQNFYLDDLSCCDNECVC